MFSDNRILSDLTEGSDRIYSPGKFFFNYCCDRFCHCHIDIEWILVLYIVSMYFVSFFILASKCTEWFGFYWICLNWRISNYGKHFPKRSNGEYALDNSLHVITGLLELWCVLFLLLLFVFRYLFAYCFILIHLLLFIFSHVCISPGQTLRRP